jgi:hypothetical protein
MSINGQIMKINGDINNINENRKYQLKMKYSETEASENINIIMK